MSIHKHQPRLPWHVDEEKAEDTFPNRRDTDHCRKVAWEYKDVYHSTPYHKEIQTIPDEILVRTEPGNPRLAVERLSLFLQSVLGPPGLEQSAATAFLNTLSLSRGQIDIELAAVAIALDHVLVSNGGVGATLTVARTASGFDFEREPRRPLYFRFQKGVADTDIAVPRYPDKPRTEAKSWVIDHSILQAARRIQARATDEPVEIELALESDRVSADLAIGVEIRDETTLDDLYRERDRDD